MMNDSIYILPEEETPPTTEEDDIRNDYNIWKAPEDSHCVIHCFGEQFNKSNEFVLQRLWYKVSNSSHIYMEFGTYLSPDELTSEISKYIFDKSYEFDTAKHFLEFISAECSFNKTNLKTVLQAMLEKLLKILST